MEADDILADGLDTDEVRPGAARGSGDLARQFLAGLRLRDTLESLDRGAVLGFRVAKHALAAERKNHVLCSHLLAIVEADALTQVQLDRLVVDPAPFGRQARPRRKIAQPLTADETLPERREEHALADVGLLAQHVQRVRVGDLLDGDGNGRTVVRLGNGEARQGRNAKRSRAQSHRLTAREPVHVDLRCLSMLRAAPDLGRVAYPLLG